MSLFSDRLRWARERTGLSQKEMAASVNMSQQGYSNIETGKREPNLTTLISIRNHINESTDFLLGFENLDRMGLRIFKDLIDLRVQLVMTLKSPEVYGTDDEEILRELKHMRVSKINDMSSRLGELKKKYIDHIASVPHAEYVEAVVLDLSDGTVQPQPYDNIRKQEEPPL